MTLLKLDHVNMFTTNLSAMVDWYQSVMGMVNGDRPSFSVDGAWLYLGSDPVVHLSEVAEQEFGGNPRLDHFAFSATGLRSLIDRLGSQAIAFETARVPGSGTLQVRFSDFDGNRLHLDFSKTEADALGY